MKVRISDDSGPIYTGKRTKPFAVSGEVVNVRKDVAKSWIEKGLATPITEERKEDDDA